MRFGKRRRLCWRLVTAYVSTHSGHNIMKTVSQGRAPPGVASRVFLLLFDEPRTPGAAFKTRRRLECVRGEALGIRATDITELLQTRCVSSRATFGSMPARPCGTKPRIACVYHRVLVLRGWGAPGYVPELFHVRRRCQYTGGRRHGRRSAGRPRGVSL